MTEINRESMALKIMDEGGYTKENIEAFFRGMDIDVENYYILIFAAIAGHANGWKFFPESVKPRLQFLYRYHFMEGMLPINRVAEYIKALSTCEIPVMLTGEFALRVHFFPDFIRPMTGADLIVKKEPFFCYDNIC